LLSHYDSPISVWNVADTAARNLSGSTDSSVHLKKCWPLGGRILVVIADELVKRFGITEDDTYVQQEVTDDGILLRVKHYGSGK
jgi:hypothetical protein